MAEIVERKPRDIAKDIAQRFFRHENAVLLGILVIMMAVMAVITKGLTVTQNNITNIWLQSSMRGIASMGQLFVILTAGIDVSVGGIALTAAILGAKLMTGQADISWIAIAAMLGVGAGIGAFNGSMVSRVGMPALIVTLGMWQVTNGISYLLCRGQTILNLPPPLNFFGGAYLAGVPLPVIIFIMVAVIAYFVLNHTTFGRSVYAVGGNPISAWLSGINVKNILFSVFVISGFLAALAGFVMMSRVMIGGLTTVVGLELDSIAAVCIGGVSLMGGRGTVIGVLIGVLILGVINNGMNVFAVSPAYQDVVKGSVIIAAVAVDYMRRR